MAVLSFQVSAKWKKKPPKNDINFGSIDYIIIFTEKVIHWIVVGNQYEKLNKEVNSKLHTQRSIKALHTLKRINCTKTKVNFIYVQCTYIYIYVQTYIDTSKRIHKRVYVLQKVQKKLTKVKKYANPIKITWKDNWKLNSVSMALIVLQQIKKKSSFLRSGNYCSAVEYFPLLIGNSPPNFTSVQYLNIDFK